jgi:hypothetical protein
MESKLYVPKFSALYPGARLCRCCQRKAAWLATLPSEPLFHNMKGYEMCLCDIHKPALLFRVTKVPNATPYPIEHVERVLNLTP